MAVKINLYYGMKCLDKCLTQKAVVLSNSRSVHTFQISLHSQLHHAAIWYNMYTQQHINSNSFCKFIFPWVLYGLKEAWMVGKTFLYSAQENFHINYA